MFRRLRNLILLGIVAIAAAAFVRMRVTAESSNTTQNNAAQDTSVIDTGNIMNSINAAGTIQAAQSVTLSFPTTGKVIAISVNEGDHILKGQTIATLDTQSAADALQLAQAKLLSAQVALRQLTQPARLVDVTVAQMSLNLAKAKLASASSGPDALQAQIDALNVETAKNALYQAELQRDASNAQKAQLEKNPRTAAQAANLPTDNQNNATLNSAGYDVQIAQSQVAADQSQGANVGSIASAQASVLAAQIALNKLTQGPDKNDLAKAQAELDAAQAAVDAARENLGKTVLTAPFDGVVAKLNLHLGEQPPTTTPAVTFLDTSSFYTDIAVDEADISKVALNQPSTLTLDALPGVTVNGKVIRVAQTAVKNGDVVTYTVRVQIDPAGQPLLSAMSTTASVITQQANRVVRIRNRYVRLDRPTGKTYATVRQPDGTFKEVEITLGIRDDTYSEVKSGLQPGDVVTAPQVTGVGGPGGPGGGLRIPFGGGFGR